MERRVKGKLWWEPLESLERMTKHEMEERYDGYCVFYCGIERGNNWQVITCIPYAISNADAFIDHEWNKNFIVQRGETSSGIANLTYDDYPAVGGIYEL